MGTLGKNIISLSEYHAIASLAGLGHVPKCARPHLVGDKNVEAQGRVLYNLYKLLDLSLRAYGLEWPPEQIALHVRNILTTNTALFEAAVHPEYQNMARWAMEMFMRVNDALLEQSKS